MEDKNKETVSLKSIFVGYLRRWKLFLIAFIISIIPAVLYLTLYPRTYEFAASILLIDEKESGMSGLGIGGDAAGLMKSFGIGGGGGSINVEDEMSILTSNRMLRLTIKDLGLNVLYSKPYSFYYKYNDAPLKLTADPEAMAAMNDEYRFNVSVKPGIIKVKAKSRLGGDSEVYTYTSLPATIKVGKKEFRLDYDNNGSQLQSFNLKIKCVPAGWHAEDILKKLEVEEYSNVSNVLNISYNDHSIERGVDMINTMVEKYNKDKIEYKNMKDNKTMAFVDGRISNIVTDLAKVEVDIEEYKAKNDMTLLETDVSLYGEVYLALQSSIVEAEVQSRQVKLLDEYIKDPENAYSAVPPLLTSTEGEQGTVSAYNLAIVERDRLLINSNESNEVFITANSKVEKLRNGVYAMIENAYKNSEITLAGLKAKEQQILSKMKTVPAKEREYRGLKRDQEILEVLYVMLLQKKETTVLSLGKQTESARLIEPAFVKKKPLGPRKLYAALGMMIFTLVVPIGYIFAKDLFLSIKKEYMSGA